MTAAKVSRLTSPRATLRGVAIAQTLGAAALAVYPHRATRVIGNDRRLAPPAWIVRVLGVRSLLQGAAELRWPTPAVACAGAVVDATHAASMVLVAARSRRYRRAALVSGGFATVAAAAQMGAAARELRSN
jgi:hypothetical protein